MSDYKIKSFWGDTADLTYAQMLDTAERICIGLDSTGVVPPDIAEMADGLQAALDQFNEELAAAKVDAEQV